MSVVRSVGDVAFAVACVVISAVGVQHWWDGGLRGRPSPAEQAPGTATQVVELPVVNVGANQSEGERGAPVGLVEFIDFECQFCAKFAREVYPTVRASVVEPGRVRRVVVHRPLPGRRYSAAAAGAAECAATRGRFWELYSYWFENQASIGARSVTEHLAGIGLDMADVTGCLKNGNSRVSSDVDLAERLEVRSTPTFLVGTLTESGDFVGMRRIVGLSAANDIIAAIESVESQAAGRERRGDVP